MQLTKEQFANIVAGRDGGLDHGTGVEKRRAARHLVWVRAAISVNDGPLEDVRLRDISSRGVRLFYQAPMARGQQFIMELASDSPTEARSRILCSTLHCKEVDDDNYSIGAEFTCSVTAESTPSKNWRDVDRIRGSILT